MAADYPRQLQASPELPYQLQKISSWKHAVPRAGSHKALLGSGHSPASIAEHSKLYLCSHRVKLTSDGAFHV